MITFSWNNGEVPENLKITQVYGLVFTEDGRMLLKIENDAVKGKIYSLAGGKPEKFDASREETLRREMIEEVNTKLKEDIYLVGYQEVDEGNEKPPYAQIRMTAIIDEIGPSQPDFDGGKIYERLLTTPEKAIKLLNWGETGEKQIKEAVRIAKEKLGIKTFSDFEEYV